MGTRHSGESGQTLIIGAFFMVGVFGLFALVLDVGGAWVQRRSLQNTADAAALAGAQLLNGTAASETAARAVAVDYATTNVPSLDAAPDVSFSDGSTKISVQVKKTAKSFFIGTMGIGNQQIAAHAAAKIRSQNLPGKGVVPIGIEKSDYDALVASGGTVTLKDKGQDGANSNSGLVNLIGDHGDQIRDGFKFGSGVPLQPTLNTEPGNKFGQATQNHNSGLRVRLSRALAHAHPADSSKHCYTWADVQPPSDPNAFWPCSPANATETDGVQATAVILVPIIVEDFTQLNGTKTIHVQPTAGGSAYLLAYFWVDGNSTYVNPAANDYNLNPANPKGAIYGRFILGVAAQLSEFDPTNCRVSDGCGLVDFDPQAVIKVVQLVE